MADEETLAYKKQLLRKDKLELVKILKGKKQPTNGNKADLVDRILAYNEKTGGTMASEAVSGEGADSPPGYDEEDGTEKDLEAATAPKKRKKSKPKSPRTPTSDDEDDDDDEDGGGGGPGIDCNCAGGGARPDCDGGVGGFAQIATALAAIGQLILGILQFAQLAPALEICDDSVVPGVDCVGESLVWDYPGVDETSSELNEQWRTVFTLRPSFFFANWTPMLFAMIAVMQFFPPTRWDLVSGSWLRCFFFHCVMFLFAAFGYCGQAGVVIAFVEVFAAFMCFVMVIVTKNGGGTYLTWNFCG